VEPRAGKLNLPPISAAAPGPLYEQIVAAVTEAVDDGRLRPGDALPSFRALAEELMVSLITVKRAYEELERAGILFRKQGLGTFIADDATARSRDARRAQVKALLREAVAMAERAGMEPDEFAAMLARIQHKPVGTRGAKKRRS